MGDFNKQIKCIDNCAIDCFAMTIEEFQKIQRFELTEALKQPVIIPLFDEKEDTILHQINEFFKENGDEIIQGTRELRAGVKRINKLKFLAEVAEDFGISRSNYYIKDGKYLIAKGYAGLRQNFKFTRIDITAVGNKLKIGTANALKGAGKSFAIDVGFEIAELIHEIHTNSLTNEKIVNHVDDLAKSAFVAGATVGVVALVGVFNLPILVLAGASLAAGFAAKHVYEKVSKKLEFRKKGLQFYEWHLDNLDSMILGEQQYKKIQLPN